MARIDPSVRREIGAPVVRHFDPLLDRGEISGKPSQVDLDLWTAVTDFVRLGADRVGTGHGQEPRMVGPSRMVDLITVDAGRIVDVDLPSLITFEVDDGQVSVRAVEDPKE